ncbi:hemin uptake protein HemP [Salinarimonas rosea]|uniref:hemin uptake protein HemP n=1 Tax=Salinarimonas rosea TaxID=552063 RepID=UPI000409C3C1|nr:hemin uptake protein HemP [Salinarimonas rosea]
MNSKEEPNIAAQDARAPGAPPVVDVRALVGEGREAIIRHNGESYRLRITAANKLILTK